MKKKALSFLLSLAMVLTLVPALGVEAWAEGPSEYEYLVPTYVQENIATSGVISWSIETKAAVNVTVVSSSDERVDWNEGWYVVKDEDVTINNGVNLLGNVHLILTDGASLIIMGQENPGINVNSYSLVIYGQTKNTGNLNASSFNCSGIGGSNITINGGKIDANGGNGGGAGIGSNDNGDGSNIIINGGIIYAMGGDNGGAGIGGGANGVGSEITINGGSVQAYGCGSGAGIGGGVNGTASNITINGGTVFAQCNGGDTGIGKGSGCETPSSNIFVNENLIIKADATNCNPITEVAANRDNLTDISATLSGFKFVQIDPAVELISGFAIKYFKTVSKAAIEAKSGNTIKLFVNTTGNAIEVSGKAITLDLNGYVLSGEDNENKSVITVCSDGELTITDSAVKTAHPHYFTLTTTGQTIRLITNVAISAALNITNEKEFTLDLNGFVIKQTSQASVIQNQGKLTIEDNNSDKPTYYYTVSSSGIWVWEENVTDAIITSAHALGYYESTPSAISTGAVVAISGGAMTNGKGTEVSGNILGGCVYNINPGKLVLSDVSIVGNIASGSTCNQGGGIFNEHLCTIELMDVNIVGNMVVSTESEAHGGGIHNKSSAKCTGGSISFNISHASYIANGGGINNMGGFTMNESLVIGNKANGGYAIGGGINNSNNEMEITKCNVNNNTAISPYASYGGGICLQDGLLWLGSSNIHNNTVSAPLDCGGGIINLGGSITVSGIMSIKNNIASSSCNANNMVLILPIDIYDLDNNSDIGISLIDSSCATTTGAISTTGASFASAFFSDNARQELKASGGALYLQKKSITITAGSSSKTHDGTALTCDTYTSTGSLAVGDVLYVTVSGIQTEKGSSENIVSEVAIISASSEDVTELYSITTVSGVLTVNEKSNPVPSAPTESKRELKINTILNGSVTSSVDAAYQGTKITLTVTANEGYELDTITAKDLLGQEVALTEVTKGKTYTFVMPASFVSVDAVFKKIEKEEPIKEPFVNPFVDIFKEDYFYDAVLWAAENGITSGMDATHFDPMRITTRAQMVTFLWRAAGCPEPEKASVFTDLEEGSYYEKAVAWGYENGYVKGISATEFAPNMTVTRAQTVTFLARLNGVLDESTGYNHDFLDVFKKDYYNNAVAWAKTEGITSGMGDNLFAPLNDCLRGQIVTFIYRNYVK